MPLGFQAHPVIGRMIGSHSFLLSLAIPIALSAFTHLWNPIGFPFLQPDESTYMRRTMYVLEGLGPQESTNDYNKQYDHPYFGQLFLASVLGMIRYPDSLSPTDDGNTHSIGMLFIVPRILMGILAVADTFFIYKIAERRYNRTVAFIASILFAVMPITWLLRRIFLDNLLLPFLLSSILFAVYIKKPSEDTISGDKNNKERLPLVIISGIFLGLAIFTKIPAFAFIPVVGFLIFTNTNRSLKALSLWFIPIILIPSIWPALAISTGEFNYWLDGVTIQATREGGTLIDSLNSFFKMDPVLILLGIVGTVFAIIRKDYLVLLWMAPYLLFLHIINFVSIIHLVMLLPPFSVAAARLISELSSKINNIKIRRILPFIITSGFSIFALLSITMLITTNLNSYYFEVYAFIVKHLPSYDNKTNSNNKATTLIGRYWAKSFYWIPQYVFQKELDFISDDKLKLYMSKNELPIKNDKLLLIVDNIMLRYILKNNKDTVIGQYYNNTYPVAKFEDNTIHYDTSSYPYTSLHGPTIPRKIEIRANY
jgi:4-amino-4-deoxy-L-arabinose transferase-like glycosyltransferase